jgi:hypothetical protein
MKRTGESTGSGGGFFGGFGGRGSINGRSVTSPGAKAPEMGPLYGTYISVAGAAACAIALIVIGAMTLAGKIPASGMVSRYAIGFGAGLGTSLFINGQVDKPGLKKTSVITSAMITAAAVTLGVLCLKGILSAHTVAIGMLATSLGGLFLYGVGKTYCDNKCSSSEFSLPSFLKRNSQEREEV